VAAAALASAQLRQQPLLLLLFFAAAGFALHYGCVATAVAATAVAKCGVQSECCM